MRTCPNCGATLKDTDSVCPYCGSNVGGNKFFVCVNCNHPISSSSTICPYCGKNPHIKEERTNAAEARTSSNKNSFYASNQSKTINGMPAGIILVIVLNLVGFLICLILGDKACKKGAWIALVTEIILVALIYLIANLVAVNSYPNYYIINL